MKTKVYLRPLEVEDAYTSYVWRNTPEIWKYTKFRPTTPITPEIEQKWLLNCLSKNNEYRRAICIQDTHKYIGNVQIVDISNSKGIFHLFIGVPQYWGKGIGQTVTKQVLDNGFSHLALNTIWLEVHTGNSPAIKIYEKMGFEKCGQKDDFIQMAITKDRHESFKTESKILMEI